jgi:outer membrane protein assembly factor BamA
MKYILCAFMLFAIVLPIFSQDFENQKGNEQNENIITAISIAGLKRTKHQVIEKYLLKFIGSSASDVDINDVYAIVKDTNLVEPLSFEITDGETENGKTLTVTVQEKWSLFPVPFGGITNGKWTAGAAVIEANFFGLGDTAMLVGTFGSDSWMGSLMYMKSPKATGEFGFSAMGMFMHQDAEHTDQTRNEILRRFNKLSINPEFSVSYLLTNSITTALGVSYHYIALTDTDNPVNAPDFGVQALGLSPRISFRTASLDGYLLSEKSVSLSYMYRFILNFS